MGSMPVQEFSHQSYTITDNLPYPPLLTTSYASKEMEDKDLHNPVPEKKREKKETEVKTCL